MNKTRNPSEGPLQRLGKKFTPSNVLAASLLALTASYANKIEAATWDSSVAVSAINTTSDNEFFAAPDSSGNLLYNAGSSTYVTKVLLSGASTPTDVSATDLSGYDLYNYQPNSSSSFLAIDAILKI